MDVHRGNGSGVVDLLARDVVLDNESLPFGLHICVLLKNKKQALHSCQLYGRPGAAHSKPVGIHWASCHRPEFNQVLRSDTGLSALSPQRNKSPAYRPTVRMIAVQSSEEDIRVKKAEHLAPLVFASVNALPADRLVGQRWQIRHAVEPLPKLFLPFVCGE